MPVSPEQTVHRSTPAGWIWHGAGVSLLSVFSALLLVWGSQPDGGAARQLITVLSAAAIGGAALLWIATVPSLDRVSLRWIFGLALLLRVVAAWASPLLEDDHFRYLWDGLRTATTLDPYRAAPSAFFHDSGLPPIWQDVLSAINNPDIPTLYGPVLQYLFALAYLIAPGQVGAIQGLLLAVDMATLACLAVAGVRARWLLAYALHPLILKEAMASAHPDGLVGLCLLLAAMAWQRRYAVWVGIALGVAAATKVAALMALPLLIFAPWVAANSATPDSVSARRRAGSWAIRVLVGLALALMLLYGPFLSAGGSDFASLATFGSQWRFNPLLFRAFEWLLPAQQVRPVAALGIALAVGATVWRWRLSDSPEKSTIPPVHAVLVWLLLLSPVVNPWYWLWALAPALAAGSRYVMVIGVAAVLSYLNTTVLSEAGWIADAARPYQVSGALALIQLLVLCLAWRLYIRSRRLNHTQRPALCVPWRA